MYVFCQESSNIISTSPALCATNGNSREIIGINKTTGRARN